jgi:hypothetical protein
MTKVPVAFLCHSKADASRAEPLARDLRGAGIDVWYDEWEVGPGESLRRKIDAGIDGATHFLVLLTPASLQSEWVQTELDAGLVNRIAGLCRLIPIVWGLSDREVPATLRGSVWIPLEPYEEGRRKLIEACHGVLVKPALGTAPTWAKERPLEGAGLSGLAQRLAVWLGERSQEGTTHDLFERDVILKELELSAEQAGMAASELSEEGCVKRIRDSGSGVAAFSYLRPLPALFWLTDPVCRGWNPRRDAIELAAAMLNLSRSGGVSLAEVDQHLGWGPRRLNPAADYLEVQGLVSASSSTGSRPYTYAHAIVGFRTQSFVQDARASEG